MCHDYAIELWAIATIEKLGDYYALEKEDDIYNDFVGMFSHYLDISCPFKKSKKTGENKLTWFTDEMRGIKIQVGPMKFVLRVLFDKVQWRENWLKHIN